MRRELRPLYAVTFAVVVAGLVVGLAFAGLSDDAVLVGVVILACLMVVLFVLGRRDGPHHHDDHDHHFTADLR